MFAALADSAVRATWASDVDGVAVHAAAAPATRSRVPIRIS
jgi:hypothetical protein